MLCRRTLASLFAAAALLTACTEAPVPQEVAQAQTQMDDLGKTGADIYASAAYAEYLQALAASREMLRQQQDRWSLLRDYGQVRDSFTLTLEKGEAVRKAIEQSRRKEAELLTTRLGRLEETVRTLRELSTSLKDSRLARRRLVETEMLLAESRTHLRQAAQDKAAASAERAEKHIAPVIREARAILGRYADPVQIDRWQKLAQEALAESARRKNHLILVNKLDRELVLYRNGVLLRRYPAGMGFNFLSDKLVAGDRATPEGSYEVLKKVPQSRFFKALLINYPNGEDLQRFAEAKKKGRIASGEKIGGLIEIHGGGKDGMTNGCVALENTQMLELYNRVEPGTPVIIVGTLNKDNMVVSALRTLQ